MSEPITRAWNLDGLTAAGAPLPSVTLSFAAAFAFIRSVTIDNASNAVVGVFLNGDPYGSPTYTIPPASYKTSPVNAQIVGIKVQAPKGDQPRGTVYAHLTDTALSASSGSSALNAASAVWDQSRWDDGSQMGA